MTALAPKHTLLFLVVWSALAALAFGATRHLTARAAVTPTLDRARGAASESQSFHVATGDLDMGPGDAEPALAQHAVY